MLARGDRFLLTGRPDRRLVCALLLSAGTALAHPGLDEQIERLDAAIAQQPGLASLYLERGDLHRRHGDFQAAEADFATARRIDPVLADDDWREGRALGDAGRWADAVSLLTAYLDRHPGESGALEARAEARSRLGFHDGAAQDYQAIIAQAERPAPVLFSAAAVEWLAADPRREDRAEQVLTQGLVRYPDEVGLQGLAADLALARGDLDRARRLIVQGNPFRLRLPQWAWRADLLDCYDGVPGARESLLARDGFVTTRPGTWNRPVLPADPATGEEGCRQFAAAALEAEIGARIQAP